MVTWDKKLNKEELLKEIEEYRPAETQNIEVKNVNGERFISCFCGEEVKKSIVPHLKAKHQDLWREWKRIFVKLYSMGYSWKRIMKLFSARNGKLLFSWTVVENAIKGEVEGGNITFHPHIKNVIKKWHPEGFRKEKTTVWDFPKRGDWAVHSSNYRGNWPPEIPRNLILRYTKAGDIVVDAFAGGGTTLIEAWLLNRRSIGLDISKLATDTIKANLKQMEEMATLDERIRLNYSYKPLVIKASEANALKLSEIIAKKGITGRVVKLICAHPPYLDSIKYTMGDERDLALIHDPLVFYDKMRVFAQQVKNIICPDGICAILIGDVKKNKRAIPLGFKTLEQFLIEGFELENIVIKTQHKDRSTEFWVGHKSDILLMAHEYLFIMRLREEKSER